MHYQQIESDYKMITLSSEVIDRNGIQKKYTCDGENINPPIDIKGMPLNTNSLVLILEELLTGLKPILHWLVWNLPVTNHIKEDIYIGQQGINDFGCLDYRGPCQPVGISKYIFKIYALDELIDMNDGRTKAEIENAMQGHIIGYGELEFMYIR